MDNRPQTRPAHVQLASTANPNQQPNNRDASCTRSNNRVHHGNHPQRTWRHTQTARSKVQAARSLQPASREDRRSERAGRQTPRKHPSGLRASNGRSPILLIFALVVIAIMIIGGVTAANAQRAARERAAAEQQALELERSMQVNVDKLDPADWPSSTPRDQWCAGTMPHLYQTDPLWAYKPYAGGTVRTNACGPASLCMVYIYLTGHHDLDPGILAQFADSNNFAPTGATEWSFMTRGASMIGISGKGIAPNRAHVEQALRSGKPVICSMRPGTFTNVGHYLVLHGIDKRGMVRVYDPNSPINSARSWGLQTVLLQTAMAWEFSL